MRVLVGITSKNRSGILPKAITSVLNQTYPDKEVWVFDDASTDDTHLLAGRFPEVKWIFSDVPRGYVYARNLLMNQPGFDFYCSLDDDSWFMNPNSLAEGVEILKNDSTIAALGYDMLSPDHPSPLETEVYLKESNNFIGCGHIIRLQAAKQINFYTPNPGFYGTEEKDLSIRLVDIGYRVMVYKGVYVWHDKTSVARNLDNQHRSGVCNDMVFIYRRTPAVFLWPTLVIQTVKHLKFSLSYKEHNFFPSYIEGIKDFVRWLLTKKTYRKAVSLPGFIKFIKARK
jgi:glycosyltransferase involved in cell wall biosynthesis